MKKMYIYILTDCNGKILARGRKNFVCGVEYPRWCYGHIFNDCLYQTTELYTSEKDNIKF